MKALDGLTVLDLSDHLSGQACAQVLLQAGARSIIVEPVGGVRSRTFASDQPESASTYEPTYLFQHLNRGKASVVLDPRKPESAARCEELVRRADIVITSDEGPFLARTVPSRVVQLRVSDFPPHTEMASWRGSEMIHQALSGTMYVTGDERSRPLFGVGQRAYWAAGYTAAIGVLSALVERHRSGRGQRIEVNVFEACAAMAQNLVTQYSYNGTWPTRRAYPGMLSIIRCRDAWVVLFAFGRWEGICRAFGVPELAADPRFAAADDRLRSWTEITALLQAGAAVLTADQVVAEAQANKVCAEKVASIEDVLGSSYFLGGTFPGRQKGPVSPKAIADAGVGPWLTYDSDERDAAAAEARVPTLGEHTRDLIQSDPGTAGHQDDPPSDVTPAADKSGHKPMASTGPLAGVRVLDLTSAWAGPMATRCLAFLGAEVIKVEAPTHPDIWRATLGRDRFPGMTPGPRAYNRSALFNTQNHDKLSVGLDLKTAGGLSVVEKLVARSDIVISNFSPGVMERLGLGYDRLRTLNDRIVNVEMPAFRTGSDMARHVGMGKTMEAASGMGGMIGYTPDGPPVPTGPAYLDPIGGLHGATAALLGYLRAIRFGRGSHLEVAQTDAATRWIGEYLLEHLVTGRGPSARGNAVRRMAPHDCFPCRGQDEWIAIAIDDDQAWARLTAVIGDRELMSADHKTIKGRLAATEFVYERVAAWTRHHDKAELARNLQARHILAAPVNNGKDIHRDEILRTEGFLVRLRHPEAGTHEYPSLAFRLDRTPGQVRQPAPTFGQHNDFVLTTVLGMPPEEIDSLRMNRVLYDDPLPGEFS